MAINRPKVDGNSAPLPPSVCELFARAITGQPMPAILTSAGNGRGNGLYEGISNVSSSSGFEPVDIDAQRNRASLEWAATFSTEAEAKLRALQCEEAAHREAWRVAREYAARLTEDTWDPSKHPRLGGPPNPGWWASTRGSTGGGKGEGSVHTVKTASYTDGGDEQGDAELTDEDVRNYFGVLYGRKGQKLLDAFERSGGLLKVESPYFADSALDSRNFWHPHQIRLRKTLNPVQAAQELMARLIEASGLTEVRQHLDHYGFENIDTLIDSYKQSVKKAADVTALIAELYLSGISIVSEGADWVITFSELSEGNYQAAIGLLPLLPASVGKTGVILKHGTQKYKIPLKAVRTLPVAELTALLESTAKLARNMAKAGITKPANTAAHHIVPATLKKFPNAVRARKILANFGISVENAANGVFLPSKFDDAVKAAYHGSVHTTKYCDELYRRLSRASSKEEALIILDRIRKDLLTGKFPY